MVRAPDPKELITFALDALQRMQLADRSFCFEIRRGIPAPEGRSLRYTIITALGLARASSAGYRLAFDVRAISRTVLRRLNEPALSVGDAGLALWLATRVGGADIDAILVRLQAELTKPDVLQSHDTMEAAWIVIGTAQALAAGANAAHTAHQQALDYLLNVSQSPSGLIYHRGTGWRRRFPNFATQIYSLLALGMVARLRDHTESLVAARRLGDRLLNLQRPDGGWPWMFDAVTGRVVEDYELYVVHQDAMAPMGLFELYKATGEDRYRAAAIGGLPWISGRNDLGADLWDRAEGILCRSIRRASPWNRLLLYANTAAALAKSRGPTPFNGRLEIDPTDRPYHLGWILEAWVGREHLAGGNT